MTTRYTTCECGRRLPTSHLAHHKRHTCPKVERNDGVHCASCRRSFVASALERYRSGLVPEAVAKALSQRTTSVLAILSRARQLGCLPPAPLKGSEAYEKERAARALYAMGTRACEQCGNTYVPALGATMQKACSHECARILKNHARSENAPAPKVLRAESAPVPEREAEAMRPQREKLAAAGAQADGVRMITGDDSWTLWVRCLGLKVAA